MSVKQTGIIRRFDDLGRIVIPKTLRKEFNHGESDMTDVQMEISIDGDMIVLRKYESQDEE
jgi:transcriptional pleiotropic regulator of transition state genes